MIDYAAGQLLALFLFAAMIYGWKNPSERFLFWVGFVIGLLLIAWRVSCWTGHLTCTH